MRSIVPDLSIAVCLLDWLAASMKRKSAARQKTAYATGPFIEVSEKARAVDSFLDKFTRMFNHHQSQNEVDALYAEDAQRSRSPNDFWTKAPTEPTLFRKRPIANKIHRAVLNSIITPQTSGAIS